jgi:hypothetical protein
MSDDGIQAVVTVVILLVCLAAIFIPLAAFFVYVVFQTSKRKRIQARMLTTHRELVGNHPWLPARYASKPRFDSWLKIFPWEGAGVLVFAPGSVLFLGETNSGTPVNIQFAPSNSTLNWIGKTPFPNGAVSWFMFTMADRQDYFSSETGAFVFGSHNSTKQLYDEAYRSFSGG